MGQAVHYHSLVPVGPDGTAHVGACMHQPFSDSVLKLLSLGVREWGVFPR